MYKIGLITEKFHLSHRTLRFWEEAGILRSIRGENGYRYYDEENCRRIKQIMVLRKLELPIKDIEEIYLSKDFNSVISILNNHLLTLKKHSDNARIIGLALSQLINILDKEQNLSSLFLHLDSKDELALEELKANITSSLEEGENVMDKVLVKSELRIVNLPMMIVASITYSGEEPETACWNAALKLIEQYKLDKEPGFRNFGFGYNNSDGDYLYELWISIPKDFLVPAPFIRKEVNLGLYASLPANLSNIGDKWQELHELVVESSLYEHDTQERLQYLEECLDIITFHSPNTKLSERQLDLLLPIKRVEEKTDTVVTNQFEPTLTVLPTILLGGAFYELKEKVKPWRKAVPWYKLAQSIYKVGTGFNECMLQGNNTFTLVYGNSVNDIPFYVDVKKGRVHKVFGAVQLLKSFSNYPDDLEEITLKERKYLLFSTSVDPKNAKSTKLSVSGLYEAARNYLFDKIDLCDDSFCLERDYRADGRYVDKIELYIPLKE